MVLGGVVGQKVLADGIPKESLTRLLAQVKISGRRLGLRIGQVGSPRVWARSGAFRFEAEMGGISPFTGQAR